MQEFIEKLIGRLEEEKSLVPYNRLLDTIEDKPKEVGQLMTYQRVIEIVNQLAEEYEHCIKSSCSNCEVYDKEKHYCPKWCDVIKHTTKELAEEHNNDFCEWEYDEFETKWQTDCGVLFALHDSDREITQFCPYCGKKIKVAPYTEGE